MRASIIRRAHFNAAHRLSLPEWSQEKNSQVFGQCANPNYHGHNYVLEVKVTGQIDPKTGMVMDLKDLKDIIDIEVIEPFDHTNLNLDSKEFKTLNPTAENIAAVIWKKIRSRIDASMDLHIRLYETERNSVEFDGK